MRKVIIGSVAILFIFLIFYLSYQHSTKSIKHFENKYDENTIENQNTYSIDNETIKRLSMLLTKSMKRFGQLSCENAKDQVSENGGWCQKISGTNSTRPRSIDEALVSYLSNYLADKAIASFGDGPGFYKNAFLKMNKVRSYEAYDGAPFAEETTNNNVNFLDLTVPVYHIPLYDWVICLEVAEHIPVQFEDVFIENLVRHAKEGIVLSWAKLGQGGLSHVNNRAFSYVKEQMEKRGFTHNYIQSEKLKDACSLIHYKWNINIFERT